MLRFKRLLKGDGYGLAANATSLVATLAATDWLYERRRSSRCQRPPTVNYTSTEYLVLFGTLATSSVIGYCAGRVWPITLPALVAYGLQRRS